MIVLNSNNVQVCNDCGAIGLDQPLYREAHARAIHGIDPDDDQTLYRKLWSNID